MKEIAYVEESNGVVRAYDKNNHILVEHAGDLVGYSSSTVSIDDGYAIQVYRAEGGILRSLPSRHNSFSSRQPNSNVNKSEENKSQGNSGSSSRDRPTGSDVGLAFVLIVWFVVVVLLMIVFGPPTSGFGLTVYGVVAGVAGFWALYKINS